ncbi:glycosyltransferase family 4 protein [Prochlorococcus marinus]|uniref:glycosyltransferase family 4 protein n=1 Tax=Prochlorococcus marinus TaxID=1219 RepID=UPI001ADADDAE|nr:glycosyltransferase family 4 protein [Prochlorococcus marinus]MBO8217671.1 glycosyltransferase family 4 protein [Prochlorococcus marinus XMU1405]MBW3040833.1 glycosyltransferase family 4 protein [Prochlorococcus marinus str. MU1405]MBW3048292.1 glycosyltransferase family 4 protein [Prochlorococcus marinus str. MU1406]
MKIVFAIKNLSTAVGGAEKVLCNIASNLANRGHEVTIITFDPIGSSSFYHLDSKIRRLNLEIGDSSSKANFLETFCRIIALRKVIKEEKPKVVIGFMNSIYVLLAFALQGTSIPIIASEHIVIEHYQKRALQFLLLIITSFLINEYTVLSDSIKKRYPFLIKRKMTIIPNPIGDIKINKLAKQKSKRKILLNIGRLEHQKDHLTLIKAFSRIAVSFPKWDLRIVGEGSLKKEIEKKIISLNLINRVFIQSFTKEIELEYIKADLFVVPSIYESFGLVTAEAMSFGIPCVGFADCPGTNELIINEKTGLLVNSGGDRSSSLASGLTRLILNDKLRTNLGKAGKAFIDAKFSDEEVTNSWERLLYNVIRNKC